MLVLSRKVGEKVIIDGNITLTVVETDGGRVRLGIDAPGHVRIMRSELLSKPHGARPSQKLDPRFAPEPEGWAENAATAALALTE